MQKYIIKGGHKLKGSCRIHSAKNAILPIISACLLANGTSIIRKTPNLTDINSAIKIIESLGATAEINQNENLIIDTTHMNFNHIPYEKSKLMRASITFLGSILGRFGSARIGTPGGCSIGARSIDLHLKSFKQMGVIIKEYEQEVECTIKKLRDTTIKLPFPSVGATENIMLLASAFEGQTIIINPAREPEIVDLGNALISMGVQIKGLGTKCIKIIGTKNLKTLDWTPIPDRIVATTIMAATAITGGKVTLKNVIIEDLKEIIGIFHEMGCKIEISSNKLTLTAPKILNPINYIRTSPHPGFPTDAQSIIMAALTKANGTSVISENVFENRFAHVEELNKMGANITTVGTIAVIRGVNELKVTAIEGQDLRGTAALLIAALGAKGTSELTGIDYLNRGYMDFYKTLNFLGANIKCK